MRSEIPDDLGVTLHLKQLRKKYNPAGNLRRILVFFDVDLFSGTIGVVSEYQFAPATRHSPDEIGWEHAQMSYSDLLSASDTEIDETFNVDEEITDEILNIAKQRADERLVDEVDELDSVDDIGSRWERELADV